jgi:hypothetical protein
MKIRQGFVSNSSSSSFIVILNDQLSKENFLKALLLEPNSPLYENYGKLFDYCINSKYVHIIRNEQEFAERIEYEYGITLEELEKEGHPEWLSYVLDAVRAGRQMFLISLSYNEDSTEMKYGSMLSAVTSTENIQVRRY